MNRTMEERLWSKIDRTGGPDACWLWTASSSKGYGRLYVEGRFRVSHRIVYELLVGPIPAGLQIDHLCRNHSCNNPAHLEPVTPRENTLRSPLGAGGRARRTHCPQGHEYTPENTAVSSKRQRHCKTCKRERTRLNWRRYRKPR